MKNKFRHGELKLTPVSQVKGNKLPHCVLAVGEQTGHKHEITIGEAELYDDNGTLFLKVISNEATITHPDHKDIVLPKGIYEIKPQREYVIGDEKYRQVSD